MVFFGGGICFLGHPFVCSFVCLGVSLFCWLFVCLDINLFGHSLIWAFIRLGVFGIHLFVHLFVCAFVCLEICLFGCL